MAPAAADAQRALQALTLTESAEEAGCVAGLAGAMEALRELIVWPQTHAELASRLGLVWPSGLLLIGPPGTGKTTCVRAVAAEAGAALHVVEAGSVFGAFMGESERRLRSAFDAAQADADAGRGAVLFLDEVDALCPRREADRLHESRVVAQLLTLLDGVASARRQRRPCAAVVAATNRPNALDPALRRPGRLERELLLPLPDALQRANILRLHCAALPLHRAVDLAALGASCKGFSGADLVALCREAAMAALSAAATSDAGDGNTALGTVTGQHFDEALRRVKPTATRGLEVEVPAVRWEDIGGLQEVKAQLMRAVEWPLLHRSAFLRLGIRPAAGVLLYGPPGCCKTTLARAAAASSGAVLLAVSGSELFSMYVGEGEAMLRSVFSRARQAVPAIVFLDEVDAVASRRDRGEWGGGGEEAALRLLGVLLTEMDGMESAPGVVVLAASNRPEAIDPALLRPGRFDKVLYVPPPDLPGRERILRIHTRSMPLAADVDLPQLARDTPLYTGAELAGICREASLAALREDLHGAESVAHRHFLQARSALPASLTPDLLSSISSWASTQRAQR